MTGAGRPDDVTRCEWAGASDPLMLAYHDEEWGTPSRDPTHLFELLTLEGAQAGLSWTTILRKRDGYQRAFDGFDVQTIAGYDDDDAARLIADPGIVRNRATIAATIGNARAWLAMRGAGIDPVEHLWSFVGGQPRVNAFERMSELPAETAESKAMSRDLARRGFRFVGPTICYAFMQAVGMVDDHTLDCFRRAAVATRGAAGAAAIAGA
jgi:DNA-3-methyladenine glycosylase I